MKILLFGGSGALGVELKKINPDILCPAHSALDICDFRILKHHIETNKPEIIIHAAAVTDNRVVEKNPIEAINTNIIGTANLSIICYQLGIRLVYISSDYIYKGDRGNYKEEDEIMPFNLYSWSKLGGECSVVAVKNHLIIRTSFGKNTFDYSEAFTDKWSSKDYVDVVAPLIYEAALSPLTGILNLGTERKTLYDHAVERNASVKPVKVADTNYFTPVDTSLNLQRWINYKSSNSIARQHTECRVCGNKDMTKYLDLGLMPLANNLEYTAVRAKNQERFPLQVLYCDVCSLSQLSVIISPEAMYSHYLYRSSINKPYVDHCKRMAKDLQAKYNLTKYSFHIDIAANDSTLLKEFKDEIGLKVLGVEPASNLVAISEAMGIDTIADFWSLELAIKIKKDKGEVDLVTATNVFAHVLDVHDFIKGAREVLKKSGVLVIEVPYIIDYIENMEYPTTYWEHASVMSVTPMDKLCRQLKMKIIEVEKKDIHAGTIRVTIAHEDSEYEVNQSVIQFLQTEIDKGFTSFQRYADWSVDVAKINHELEQGLLDLKKRGKTIMGFGCSAKGNTLLNCAGINTDLLKSICDETPDKVGKFSPGTAIPIIGRQMIMKEDPDYILILAWNFKDYLIDRIRSWGYKGKFILPLPFWSIVE